AGAMIGNNLKTHLEALDKQMRDAAANLDFEKAARVRDEIKRLREMELAISDDPLAREVESQSPASGREKGKHNKGVARHRTAEEQERFRRLDEARAADEAARAARPNLFRKPHLDQMG
ncbi:MAG: excinuclease ABC subunit B, partial [Mesorhizobium sp.]